MDTRLIRCLAVLLIANSHLGVFYPMPQLAGDGLLGNSLFFLLSGFGLAAGDARRRRPAAEWFGRRFMKLYPSLAIVLAFVAVYDFPFLKMEDAPTTLWGILWPLPYPFVRQITTFYVIYFFWSRTRAGDWPMATIAGLIPVYFLWRDWSSAEYRTHAVHWVYYFQVFLLGVAMARSQRLRDFASHRFMAFAMPILLLAYLGTKFVLSRAGQATDQVQVLHLLAVPNLIALMGTLSNGRLLALADRFGMVKRFVDWLSGATFEVYLVHYLVLELAWVEALPLPLNLAAFWAGTFLATWLLQRTRDLALAAIRNGANIVRARRESGTAGAIGDVEPAAPGTAGQPV